MTTTIIKHCNVVPPTDASIEQSLPLVHFDTIFLRNNQVQVQNLFFYQIPCSISEFLESVVPKLESSLSITLKHFLLYAGKIFFPLGPSGRPVSRYSMGDALSLTIAESSNDFVHLTGNHSRNVDNFYNLSPLFPEPDYSSPGYVKIHVLAVQVTLFPNQGICISVNTNHATEDGTTTLTFVQAWASVTKFNFTDARILENYLPSYDRCSIEDPNGLDSMCWNLVKETYTPNVSPDNFVMPTDRVKTTFILSDNEIKKLEGMVREKMPQLVSISPFIIVLALLWTCSARSNATNDDLDEQEYLCFPIDCRTRLNSPLPSNYFGNCLAVLNAECTKKRLKGDGGFIEAVRIIKEVMHETIHSGKGILDGLEKSYTEFIESATKKHGTIVSRLSRHDYYDVDFGWGKPHKVEAFQDEVISLVGSRDFKGGIEVGLLFAKLEADSFVSTLNYVLDREM